MKKNKKFKFIMEETPKCYGEIIVEDLKPKSKLKISKKAMDKLKKIAADAKKVKAKKKAARKKETSL